MFKNLYNKEIIYDSQDSINDIIKEASCSSSENEYKVNYERIKRAPKIVQDFYNGTGIKFEKGLFKVLVAKKSNRNIFMIMIFMFIITFITSNLSNKSNLTVINGYECELTSFVYEQKTFFNVKIHPIKKTRLKLEKLLKDNNKNLIQEQNSLPIQISFSALTEDGKTIYIDDIIKSNVFLDSNIYNKSIEHYNIKNVYANILIGDKQDTINVKVNN